MHADVVFSHWRIGNFGGSSCVPNTDDSLPPGGQTLRAAFKSLVKAVEIAEKGF